MTRLPKQLLKSIADILKPPPRLSLSEWADSFRILSSEASAKPGRWKTTHFQKGIMDAFTDPTVKEVVVMKSSQVGCTEIILNIIGYHMHLDPCPILVMQPDLNMAKAFSKDRLATMIRDTPQLRKAHGASNTYKSSANSILHKSFTGGHVTIVGANSPASLASRPIRLLLCDEVDRYPLSAGAEGDPIMLAAKRLTTYWNAKKILISTPTIQGISRIETGFAESDQRYFHVPCPHCGSMNHWKWEYVKWPEDEDGTPLTSKAFLQCPDCGGEITDSHKSLILPLGVWLPSRPFQGVAGFHLNELLSPWRTFGDVAHDFLLARNNEERMKTWVNTSLGEPWYERGTSLSVDALLSRRERYEGIPPQCKVLTAGVDVQKDRIEIEIVGWWAESNDTDPECWGIKYHVIQGSPALDATWDDLDTFLLAHPLDAVCIDAGGLFSEKTYLFCKERAGRKVYAIRGQDGPRPIWPKRASRSKRYKLDFFMVGVDTAKERVYSSFGIRDVGPGYCHLPLSYDEVWAQQLTSEVLVVKINEKGKLVKQFVKKAAHTRNEALDCRVYALAAYSAVFYNWEVEQPKPKSPSVPQVDEESWSL